LWHSVFVVNITDSWPGKRKRKKGRKERTRLQLHMPQFKALTATVALAHFGDVTEHFETNFKISQPKQHLGKEVPLRSRLSNTANSPNDQSYERRTGA